jgi:superfamily II DNA or RNA helicase
VTSADAGWAGTAWTPSPEYSSDVDDLVADFYIPAMRGAATYDRLTGFFSSGALLLYWPAMRDFVAREGRIRMLCSPRLTNADIEGMQLGYAARGDADLGRTLVAEIDALLEDPVLRLPARAFAALVANRVIEVRLARVAGAATAADRRMFHDKVGLFGDGIGHWIGFRGSANETFLGLSAHGNVESFDAWPSWSGDRDAERVEHARLRFDRIWDRRAAGVDVIELPDGLKEALRQRTGDADWREILDEMSAVDEATEVGVQRRDPTGRELRRPQLRGLKAWEGNGQRGILAHATGSGKTVTGRCAIAAHTGPAVVVVPTDLVARQWVAQLRVDMAVTGRRVHLCGTGATDWKTRLRTWMTDPDTDRVAVAVAPTAASERFLTHLRGVPDLLLVGDEVHRLGAASYRHVLEIDAVARLGLSATPERAGDPDGTAILMDYFSGIVDRYTLADAMADGVLCQYTYHPHVVRLSADEETEWMDATRKIGRAIAASGELGGALQSPSVKAMIMLRARIAKKAAWKVPAAVETVRSSFVPGDHWLVYCDDADQMKQVAAELRSVGVEVVTYYSEMPGDKAATLRHFRHNGGVVVSIKCLDEGIDIPECDHALIAASSRNPREFIQRRGRVLRVSAGKDVAVIHDLLVMPSRTVEDATRQLVWGEIARAGEFARTALNTGARVPLEEACIELGIDLADLYAALGSGIEDDEDDDA